MLISLSSTAFHRANKLHIGFFQINETGKYLVFVGLG